MSYRRYFCRCRVPPEFSENAAAFAHYWPQWAVMIGNINADGWLAVECYSEKTFEFFEEHLGAIVD